jgi:hypothetical protein
MEKVNNWIKMLALNVKALQLVMIIGVCFIINSCSICEDKSVREVNSPSGKFTALIIIRNCGATTSYSTILRLKSRVGVEEDVLVIRYITKINISWDGDLRLIIDYRADNKNVCKKIEKWHGITIEYRDK